MTTQSSDAPVHTVTYLEVTPSSVAMAARTLGEWAQVTRRTDRLERFEALQRTTRPHHFAIVATWSSRAQFDSSRQGSGGAMLRDQLGPHLISGVDTRVHADLIGGADAVRGPGRLIVVTHVDVPPPHKDTCIGLLETLVAASRAEAGSVRFDVLQQADRPNHFSVVESWADQTAYDAHIVAAHTRQFRHALTPITGALYDERIYTALG
jgi:quinol monooxygenase YgiN